MSHEVTIDNQHPASAATARERMLECLRSGLLPEDRDALAVYVDGFPWQKAGPTPKTKADVDATRKQRLREKDPQPAPGSAPDMVPDNADARPVVENLFDTGTHGILAGAPGAGKTTFASHLAYSIATGTTLFDAFRVRQSLVVYVDCEGNGEVQQHVTANRILHGGSEEDVTENILVTEVTPDPFDPDPWCASILELANGEQIGLVVLDTLAAWAARSNIEIGENDNGGMARMMDKLRHIARRLNCAAIAIHHPKKDDVKSIRGAGSIIGSAAIALCLYLPDAGRAQELNLIVLKKRGAGVAQGAEYGIHTNTVQIVPDAEIETRRQDLDEWFGEQRSAKRSRSALMKRAIINPSTHGRAFMGELLEPFAEVNSHNQKKADAKQGIIWEVHQYIANAKGPVSVMNLIAHFGKGKTTLQRYIDDLLEAGQIICEQESKGAKPALYCAVQP